jgi:lipopolysaccharide/colanic/teichoic acid biosynthesis glycosyltransferase/glycosyltransferase involved in cell wall biosynthesis
MPLYPSHDSSGLRRAMNYVSFAISASVGAIFTTRPDVAYVYHPPATVAIPAMVLKAFKGVPYVYDIQDLWPETLAATGMLNSPRLLLVVRKFMNIVYRSAGRIVVLSDGFNKALISHSVPSRKIDVIPNWADEAQIDLAEPTTSRADALGFTDKFTVTFAGNIGKGQGLEVVLEAAALIQGEDEVRFLIVGGGLESENLKSQASIMGLSNVHFMARRPISEIGEVLSLSDALLVHLLDDPLFAITIPSKTQAYLMAGRPILMGVRGDAAQVIAESGGGMCFEPENAEDLVDAIRRMINLTAVERREMGLSGQRYYRERMSLSVGARRFGSVLGCVSRQKPHVSVLKRAVDILGSTIGLALLSLPMSVTALLVRVQLGSPVLFRQVRPGLHGEPFEMVKFRTMADSRDENGGLLPDGERLTALGSALRSSSLDELPELWNVLKGQMSLVGPRPLLMRYTPFFTASEKRRFDLRPGITGWAQVHGRNGATWDKRLSLDTWYVDHQSLRLDIRIMLLTVSRVFRRQGVVVDPESMMLNLDDERRERSVS